MKTNVEILMFCTKVYALHSEVFLSSVITAKVSVRLKHVTFVTLVHAPLCSATFSVFVRLSHNSWFSCIFNTTAHVECSRCRV